MDQHWPASKRTHTRMHIHKSYLQSLPIESDGVLNVALLSLDVGQVVERVSVTGIHAKGSIVAFLCLSDLHRHIIGIHYTSSRAGVCSFTLPCSLRALARLQ